MNSYPNCPHSILRRYWRVALLVGTLVLFSSACSSRPNADQFIAATLGGRAGEIKSNLLDDLPEDGKAATAEYLAAIEPIAGEMVGLLEEVAALEVETRAGRDQVVRSLRRTGDRAKEQSDRLRAAKTPARLNPLQGDMIATYDAHSAALTAYTEAYAALDFVLLAKRQTERRAAAEQVLAAHRALEMAAGPLFKQGRTWRIRPS